MRSIAKERRDGRIKRHRRVRFKVKGTAERPRLCVFRSIKHISAQLHDDDSGRCLITVTSQSKDVLGRLEENTTKSGVSSVVGKVLAEKAKEAGITSVRFDRGGYLYHGRVKALAEGAREGGLEF